MLIEQPIARSDFLTRRPPIPANPRQLPVPPPIPPSPNGDPRPDFSQNRLSAAYFRIPDRTTTHPKNPQVARRILSWIANHGSHVRTLSSPQAGSTPLLGTPHQIRPQCVAEGVADDRVKMLVVLHGKTLEAPLIDVAAPPSMVMSVPSTWSACASAIA